MDADAEYSIQVASQNKYKQLIFSVVWPWPLAPWAPSVITTIRSISNI